jgi:hypothetical protein
VYALAGLPAGASMLYKEYAILKFAQPMDLSFVNGWCANDSAGF